MACCDAIWFCKYKTKCRYFDSVALDPGLSTDVAHAASRKRLAAPLSSSPNTKKLCQLKVIRSLPFSCTPKPLAHFFSGICYTNCFHASFLNGLQTLFPVRCHSTPKPYRWQYTSQVIWTVYKNHFQYDVTSSLKRTASSTPDYEHLVATQNSVYVENTVNEH